MILNCTYRMGNNLSMMPIAELNVPLNLLGVISGLTLFFGYFSDWFLPSLIGHWMDTKGDNAYYYVFSVAVVGLFLFILGALWLKKELKRMESGRAAS